MGRIASDEPELEAKYGDSFGHRVCRVHHGLFCSSECNRTICVIDGICGYQQFPGNLGNKRDFLFWGAIVGFNSDPQVSRAMPRPANDPRRQRSVATTETGHHSENRVDSLKNSVSRIERTLSRVHWKNVRTSLRQETLLQNQG